ncbi:MAG: hypothetical protein U9O53_01510 [archaeon]|nr:hypothetical protein [archaeon]
MAEIATLQKISDDLDFLKEKIVRIENDVEEINLDLHKNVKSEYLKKLKKIDKGKFISEDEFKKEMAD